MISYIWPIGLIVISNVFYHICTKSVPGQLNPFVSLTVTYTIAALASLILFLVFNKDADIIQEYSKLNWASFVLGFAIVGLESGTICAYKAGWPISGEQIVQASILAVILIFVGRILYREPITWNKVLGIIICLTGLGMINLK